MSNCQKSRVRSCSNPAPKNGGAKCPGEWKEETACTNGACVIAGKWGSWGSWSSCNGSPIPMKNNKNNCGKSRMRTCSDPAPKNGGADCLGKGHEITSCSGCRPFGSELAERIKYIQNNL